VTVKGLAIPSGRGRSAFPCVHIRYAFNQAARHTPRWLFVSPLTWTRRAAGQDFAEKNTNPERSAGDGDFFPANPQGTVLAGSTTFRNLLTKKPVGEIWGT